MASFKNTLFKPGESPGERADQLGSLGYTVQRIGGGIYLVTRPDGRTYRVDVVDRCCSCQSTAWYGCKHILYADRFWAYDRAKADLAEARRRGVLVEECETAVWVTRDILRAICAGRDADERRAA